MGPLRPPRGVERQRIAASPQSFPHRPSFSPPAKPTRPPRHHSAPIPCPGRTYHCPYYAENSAVCPPLPELHLAHLHPIFYIKDLLSFVIPFPHQCAPHLSFLSTQTSSNARRASAPLWPCAATIILDAMKGFSSIFSRHITFQNNLIPSPHSIWPLIHRDDRIDPSSSSPARATASCFSRATRHLRPIGCTRSIARPPSSFPNHHQAFSFN